MRCDSFRADLAGPMFMGGPLRHPKDKGVE
jgi:hypothetical protein